MSLIALGLRHSALYERKMAEELQQLTDGSSDQELKRVFRLFKVDKRCWGWLSQASRVRITQIATDYAYDSTDIACVLEGLEIEELKPLLLARIATFSRSNKEQLLTAHHRPELIGEAIELFAGARSNRGAETMERDILLPLCSMLRPEHVRGILKAAEENDKIYEARRTPEFFVEMFDRTVDLHAETRAAWQEFMTKMCHGEELEDRDDYLQLRTRMEVAGMWPPGT
jgi:hypothetical protein